MELQPRAEDLAASVIGLVAENVGLHSCAVAEGAGTLLHRLRRDVPTRQSPAPGLIGWDHGRKRARSHPA